MSRILVLEDLAQKSQSGYDHVFSFRSQSADSFPSDLITPQEVDGVYDALYAQICRISEDAEFAKMFSYQDVNLLWCFKKEVFYTAYQMAVRYEIFRRLMQKHPGGHFFLTSSSAYPGTIRLHDLLKETPLSTNEAIHYVEMENKADASKDDYAGPPPRRRMPFPDVVSLGNLSQCETMVFSSFARCQAVIKYLKRNRCLLYSNVTSPRNVVRALGLGLSLYQVSLSRHANRYLYQEKAEAFCRKLKELSPFSSFVFGDLKEGGFLQARMESLWRPRLPQVLFEIDCLHRLFQKTSRLKSALLDEDVDPSKNAFCQVSRQYGVQTFVELHGAIGGKHGLVPLTANKMFVWGEAQRKRFVKWEVRPDQLMVSGCSRYAHYQKLDPNRLKRKVAKKYGLDPKRKIGLLAFMPLIRWHLVFEQRIHRLICETLETTVEAARKYGLQFIIKLHPADFETHLYENWIRKNNASDRMKVVRDDDPLALGRAVDFLIVYGSTYAIDGLAMGKPVITLFSDYPNGLLDEFAPFNVFYTANNRDELEERILEVLTNPDAKASRRTEAMEQCLNQNGMSPERRIAEILTNVQKK